MQALAETQQRLLDSIVKASRHVDIVSNDLEPVLLDNEAVVSALIRLARRGANTRIRLLVAQLNPASASSHKLLLLAKRLTTAIELRVVTDHPEWPDATWVICDQSDGIIVNSRKRLSRHVHSRAEAKAMADQYERLWQSAEPSPEMRQF